METIAVPASDEPSRTRELLDTTTTTCCVVGGGPAGAVLAYMLARAGIDVLLLEAHQDFDRDFRGDTLHPSIMEVLDELGLADRLLQLPHTRLSHFVAQSGRGPAPVVDLAHLHTKFPFITFMPQSRFLEFMTREAARFPSFRLRMGARVEELLITDGRVCGVRYRSKDGWHEVRALLTVGADGRFSRVRKLSGLGDDVVQASQPMDVLWFRLSRRPDDAEGVMGRFGRGYALVQLNRDTQWQLGLIIRKDSYAQLRAQGVQAVRAMIVGVAPELRERVDELQDWHQTSLLSVHADRLTHWHRPGLLLIGDAVHTMSPAGGNGINYAVMDAVAAANILSEPLRAQHVTNADLAHVQRARERPTRIVQFIVNLIQDNLLTRALESDEDFQFPAFMRWPPINEVAARFVAFGIKPEHVRDAGAQT